MFDLVLHVLRRRRFFLILFFSCLFAAYGAIFLFVDEEYEATATIVGVQDEGSSMISGLMRSFESFPLRLGSGRSELDKFNTIVYSRTVLEEVIVRFGLFAVYGLDSTKAREREAALETLRNSIETSVSREEAYQVTCTAPDPVLAAELTNYLVALLNQRVIDLRMNKARQNRLFLERRVVEIQEELRQAEDSLRLFQDRTGMVEVNAQVKELLSVYSKLETELLTRELQLGILENIHDPASPQVQQARMEIEQYRKKLEELKTKGQPSSVLIAMRSLPETSLEFLRRYRNVEIMNLLLKFVVPLQEQAKIEEKKESPVLQIIDDAIPPAKRSFPPRVLLSLGISLVVVFSGVLYSFLKERLVRMESPKARLVWDELFGSGQKRNPE